MALTWGEGILSFLGVNSSEVKLTAGNSFAKKTFFGEKNKIYIYILQNAADRPPAGEGQAVPRPCGRGPLQRERGVPLGRCRRRVPPGEEDAGHGAVRPPHGVLRATGTHGSHRQNTQVPNQSECNAASIVSPGLTSLTIINIRRFLGKLSYLKQIYQDKGSKTYCREVINRSLRIFSLKQMIWQKSSHDKKAHIFWAST